MFILGIIPARGGSEFTDKNIIPICGRPMIEYTIDAAEYSILNDWFVFTDKYFQYKNYGIAEPKEFAQISSWKIEFSQYCITEYERRYKKVDATMLLQPTSPLRTADDINNAINVFTEAQICDCKSLYSGYYMRIKEKTKVDNKDRPLHFQRNGAMFLTRKDLIFEGKLWQDAIEFCMPKSRSVDIDDADDILIAESILKRGITWN
jgi:CMP-N-acetylneuraminic acid synthetase